MIDLSGYTKDIILKEMLSQVPKTIDTREGSIMQTAFGPVAWYLEGMYMTMDHIQLNAYAETAVGECLDYICASRGVFRKQGSPAVRVGLFNTEIPSGAMFKTINGFESTIFIAGERVESESGYAYKLTCNTPGAIGNAYVGNLLPITAISGLTSATIGEILTAGSDEEDDESLRSRYFATFEVANFGGNIAAYRNTILAIDGIGAVQVYPAWKGGGTVLCSILDSELKPAGNGLVEQVQKIICPAEDGSDVPSSNGYGMAPIGAAVTIVAATNLTVDIACNIQFASNVQVGAGAYQSQIEEKLQEYLNSVCQIWGEPLKSQKIEYSVAIYISRIIASILAVPAIANVSNVTINGSASDLILTETAQLQQIPSLGTVTINGS